MKTHHPANLPDHQLLLCCDWGTSSFRLQLMNMLDCQCVAEIQSPIGIAGMFDKWAAMGKSMTRGEFFRRELGEQIELLTTKTGSNLTNVPVVLSGMASSSIGMEEIPYANLPFAVDGSQASVRHFEPRPDFPHDIFLISGISSQNDVMRGEETQLIGLIVLLDSMDRSMTDAICIFPGTHSKHLWVKNGHLIQFKTYMTGEVFDLMAKRSILKDSIDLIEFPDFSPATIQAFRQGVQESKSSTILNSLFTVRTNQLFDKWTKGENAFYLSGLVIGTELNPLAKQDNWPLILCGGSNLSAFYELALDELNLANRTRTIPTSLMDRAASVGQIRLFQNQLINQPAQ